MKPEDMDQILANATQRSLPPDEARAAMERARRFILSDLQPVRLLAPLWLFTLYLVAVFAVVGLISASILGLHGIHVLSAGQRGLIFPILLVAAWLAALGCAREMRPAAGTHLGAIALIVASAAFPVLFSLLFKGYDTHNFIHEGIPCLVAGLCVAIPAALAIMLTLRRGFVMQWATAGVAAGSLAGLTGLAMLELHCPNLKAIHVMVWHVAVVVLSGLLGWAIGAVADFAHRSHRPVVSSE